MKITAIKQNYMRPNHSAINATNKSDIAKNTVSSTILPNYEIAFGSFIYKFNKYTKPDSNGNLSIHFADCKETKKIHNILRNEPEILAVIHTTPNNDGNLPIHVADLEKMQEIHQIFKHKPFLLARLHATQNKNGELVMHRINSIEEMREIHKVLKTKPEIFAKIHTTQTNSGNLSMHYADLEKAKEIEHVLQYRPEVLAQIYMTKNNNNELPVRLDSRNNGKLDLVYNLILNTALDDTTALKLANTYKDSSPEIGKLYKNLIKYECLKNK